MDRSRESWIAYVGVVLMVGACTLACGGEDSVLTGLGMSFPDGDGEARQRLADVEVRIYAPGDEVCRNLVGWRRAVCGGACTPAPVPEAEPLAEGTLTKQPDGSYEQSELTLPGDGPWDVIIVGRDADGEAFLYGCSTVDSGDPANVALFRPWCDVAACAGQFHSACGVEIDCAAPGSDDPDRLGPPVCALRGAPVEWAWEENGVACPPSVSSGFFGPCRPARITCKDGVLTPEIDGICPSAGATMCGASPALDLDCDGSLPGPCGSCTAGATMSCGTSGSCGGTATCLPGGTWGQCTLTTGGAEECDGDDTDCDLIDDTADPDALTSCNSGRAANAPKADACAPGSGGCRCGNGTACGADGACCGGVCVDHRISLTDCGGCGLLCATTCVGGICMGTVPPDGGMCMPGTETCGDGDEDCDRVPDSADPDAVTWCNRLSPADPKADGCGPSECMCGESPACVDATCCGAECVDTDTSPSHCGGCGIVCETTCAGGLCDECVPATETCGEGDEDCDGRPDTTDPDAVDWCNLGRIDGKPRANSCSGADVCRCSDVPACADPDMACCGDSCVDTTSDDGHCGGCGNVCEGAFTCVDGSCV